MKRLFPLFVFPLLLIAQATAPATQPMKKAANPDAEAIIAQFPKNLIPAKGVKPDVVAGVKASKAWGDKNVAGKTLTLTMYREKGEGNGYCYTEDGEYKINVSPDMEIRKQVKALPQEGKVVLKGTVVKGGFIMVGRHPESHAVVFVFAIDNCELVK